MAERSAIAFSRAAARSNPDPGEGLLDGSQHDPLEVSVTNAYSKGAIPLNVQGIANVKVSSAEGLLENAAERFLDRPTEQIGQIAKETLEANLRGVLATLSPEEVNEDRLKFSHQLIDEADDDIKTLGSSST